MAQKREAWQILELPTRTPTAKQIADAYHKLARKWHPDLNQNSPIANERMAEINIAVSEIQDSTDNIQKQATDRIREEYMEIFVKNKNPYAAIKENLSPVEIDVSLSLDDIRDGCERRFVVENTINLPTRGKTTLKIEVTVTVPIGCDISKLLPSKLDAGSMELFLVTSFKPVLESGNCNFRFVREQTLVDVLIDVTSQQHMKTSIKIPLPDGTTHNLKWQRHYLIMHPITMRGKGLHVTRSNGGTVRSDLIVNLLTAESKAAKSRSINKDN
jgi:hypothetical protein